MLSFDVDLPNEAGLEFEVKGKRRNGEVWSETFMSLPAIPIGALADLGEGVKPAADSANFVNMLLEPDSATRFDALIRDKDRIITDTALADIMQRLFSAMSGRPTSPPVDSPGGSSATGTTSTGGSSSLALTPAGSTAQGS